MGTCGEGRWTVFDLLLLSAFFLFSSCKRVSEKQLLPREGRCQLSATNTDARAHPTDSIMESCFRNISKIRPL